MESFLKKLGARNIKQTRFPEADPQELVLADEQDSLTSENLGHLNLSIGDDDITKNAVNVQNGKHHRCIIYHFINKLRQYSLFTNNHRHEGMKEMFYLINHHSIHCTQHILIFIYYMGDQNLVSI